MSIIFPIIARSNYLKIVFSAEFQIMRLPSESPLANLFPLLLKRTAVVFALCYERRIGVCRSVIDSIITDYEEQYAMVFRDGQ